MRLEPDCLAEIEEHGVWVTTLVLNSPSLVGLVALATLPQCIEK